MGRPIAIGAYRGELLADWEGLFSVVRLESPCPPETLRAEVARVGFVGVVLSGLVVYLTLASDLTVIPHRAPGT